MELPRHDIHLLHGLAVPVDAQGIHPTPNPPQPLLPQVNHAAYHLYLYRATAIQI